jgi:alpha-tubulin suppressor-like RCC1 family protein
MFWLTSSGRRHPFVVFGAVCLALVACIAAEPPIPTEGGTDASATDGASIPDGTVDASGSDVGAEDASGVDAAPMPDAMSQPQCPGTEMLCNGTCVPDDPLNCGRCGHDCTNLKNVSGTVTCVSGACTFDAAACTPGSAHCSANPDDGCETNITVPGSCGACGNACPTSAPLCSGSGSTYACASGCAAGAPTLCPGNSCVNTTSDAQNCKGCGIACTTNVAHATPTCASSQCGFQCSASYPNQCTGACVNFSNDNNNCGGCGNVCKNGNVCIGGSCGCPGGTHSCSGSCLNNSSTASCGTSATSCSPCPVPSNGSATCNGTACGIACNANYGSCGGACVDETQNGNCGGCGVTCGVSCTSSKCVNVTGVAAGHAHMCALLSNGVVECWGANDLGELGYATTATCGSGKTPCSTTPTPVTGLSGAAIQVAAGGVESTCAVISGGAVQCWGDNSYGQLGLAGGGSSQTPVTVKGLAGPATAVSVGYSSACAIISGGIVQCWGGNVSGELGNGSVTASITPVTVIGLASVTAIAVGELHACALKSDGTVWCWGDNADDQLASPQSVCTGMEDCSTEPVQAMGVANVTAISASSIMTCALTGSSVLCWGYDQFGLGDAASTSESLTPVKVANLVAPATVSVGTSGACATAAGGTAVCWGQGPVGDGTTNDSATPVNVVKLNGVVTTIATGGTGACSLLSTGTLSCFSTNNYGEAGNGTSNPQLQTGLVVW